MTTANFTLRNQCPNPFTPQNRPGNCWVKSNEQAIEMSESNWIEASLQGNKQAFNQLVLKYQDMVFNQASVMVNDLDLAEDLAQEAFIQAYKRLAQYRGGSFRSWLLRIVTNAAYDELRRQKRHPVFSAEGEQDAEEESLLERLSDGGADIETILEQRELRTSIDAVLAGLPVHFRSAISLVDVLGLDYQEAAAALGVPIGTLKSRLIRGRLAFANRLRAADALPAVYAHAYGEV